MTDRNLAAAAVIGAVVAAGVAAMGYGVGRAHAAWLDVTATRRKVPALRRAAWSRTRHIAGVLLLLAMAVAAALSGSAR